MEIESVKTWQWMLTGIIAGLLFSCVFTASGPSFDTQPRDTIDQGEFENAAMAFTRFSTINYNRAALIDQYHKDKPLIRDLTIHPPISSDSTHRYWVTGRAYWIGREPVDPTKPTGPEHFVEEWKPFRYPANVPYTPGYELHEEKKLDKFTTARRNKQLEDLKKALGNNATFPTVVEYLKAVSTLNDAQLKYQYAWWELPKAVWTLPPAAGFLIIGIAWPLTLGALQRVGLARAPVKVKPKALPAKKPARPATPKAVPALAMPEIPAAPQSPQGDAKRYGGEFYPVEKPAHK